MFALLTSTPSLSGISTTSKLSYYDTILLQEEKTPMRRRYDRICSIVIVMADILAYHTSRLSDRVASS